MSLDQYFTSPDQVRQWALSEWQKRFRRTCYCADGAGFREESDMSIRCAKCDKPIVMVGK